MLLRQLLFGIVALPLVKPKGSGAVAPLVNIDWDALFNSLVIEGIDRFSQRCVAAQNVDGRFDVFVFVRGR